MEPTVIISELGRMGKSELVRKYISLSKANIPICHWERSSIEQLAAYLKIPTTDSKKEQPLQLLDIVNNIMRHVKEAMNLFSEGNYG